MSNFLSKYFILLSLALPVSLIGQVEICDNGIDDDNDTFIDLNDDDCPCEVIEPVSLIPNPSFEEMDCCPDDRSQLDCATDWIQASEPTTDFIHACNWLGWDDFPPPQPFPDGEGIMGFRDGRVRNNGNGPDPFWKEYAGACLINPLLQDSSYRFQFDVGFVDFRKSPPIDISFFGTTSCDFLPFGVGDPEFGCPTNSPDWIKLGEVRVNGGTGNVWVNTFLEVTPDIDIHAIAIGPDCAPVTTEISIYYFFDNLLLADLDAFDLQIKETEHPCSNDFALSVPSSDEFEYQWYKEGIALVGEVFADLRQNYGAGSYQVRILDGAGSCRVSASFDYEIPEFFESRREFICQDDFYMFGENELTSPGTYLDTFKNSDNCDVIVTLELEVIGSKYDTVEVSILEGEEFEVDNILFSEVGDYPLTLTSSIGCDSLLLLQLRNFTIYIPNAFSPNNDGVNDIFRPLAESSRIQSVHMSIYNRWGRLVFEGEEWDGLEEEPGVYVFVIDVGFEENQSKQFVGEVTILR